MKIDTRTRFTLRLPIRLFQELDERSKQIGVSVNALILQILWEYFEAKEAVSVMKEDK